MMFPQNAKKNNQNVQYNIKEILKQSFKACCWADQDMNTRDYKSVKIRPSSSKLSKLYGNW